MDINLLVEILTKKWTNLVGLINHKIVLNISFWKKKVDAHHFSLSTEHFKYLLTVMNKNLPSSLYNKPIKTWGRLNLDEYLTPHITTR